jgi:hypothetical protein
LDPDAGCRAWPGRIGLDPECAGAWGALARDLRASLPRDGGKYVPHPGCEQKSIAVYGGLYPYPALAPDDPRLLAAIDDFDAGGDAFGNMYKQGRSHRVGQWSVP